MPAARATTAESGRAKAHTPRPRCVSRPPTAARAGSSVATQQPFARPVDDRLAATLARSVQARAAAGRRDLMSHPRTPTLARAGFPAGMMKEHLPKGPDKSTRRPGDAPPDWTWHHIIPENVIEKFWEKAKPNAHKLELLKQGKPGSGALTTLVRRGYRQLREAAVYTLTLNLKSEFSDFNLSTEKLKALAVQAVADLLPEAGQPRTYEQAADRILDDSGARTIITDSKSLAYQRKTLVEKLSKAVAAAELEGLHGETAITTTLGAGKSTKASAKILDQMIRWMPGNIHQGPKSELRRNPKSNDFDPERDDGGDEFEVAARHLISEPHYATLVALNKAMVDYTRAPSDELLARAGKLLIDLTAYSVTEWSAVAHLWVEGPDGFWRIRPRKDIIGGGDDPRGRPRKDKQKVHAVFQNLRSKTPGTVAGVYAAYPDWTITTTKSRKVRLDQWEKEIGPLFHGALDVGDTEAVLDDLFIAVPSRL